MKISYRLCPSDILNFFSFYLRKKKKGSIVFLMILFVFFFISCLTLL